MEDEKSFSDICGGRLALRCRYYSPYCREFGLSSARLSLCSLTAVTCAVWLAAYGLFTLCENSMVLSATIFITILGLLGYLHFVKIDRSLCFRGGSLDAKDQEGEKALDWAELAFNPSTAEAEAGGSLSLRPAWST